jgi:hypothetical protein
MQEFKFYLGMPVRLGINNRIMLCLSLKLHVVPLKFLRPKCLFSSPQTLKYIPDRLNSGPGTGELSSLCSCG